MPTLEWIGKEKVINHHMDVPYRVLNRVYSYDSSGQHSEDNGSGNKIIHGDNLEALKSLLPEYEGRIKCIYIDPPYNTGNEGWVYNDNVNDPKIKKWLGEVVGKEGEDLSRHDKWLCMMYPRLKLLHKLLADDGAIFISIDDNEVAQLKMVCDEIFGSRNFKSQIIRNTGTPTGQGNTIIASEIDYILVYAKSSLTSFIGLPFDQESAKIYNLTDEYGQYLIRPLRKTGGEDRREDRPTMFYPISAPDGSQIYPVSPTGYESRWRCQLATYEELVKQNRIEWKQDGEGWKVYQKFYLEGRKKQVGNLWVNIEGNKKASIDVKTIFSKQVFDYPKPIDVIERIIRIITDEDDVILDSFAGSGTTAHAVLNMNKADGGNRRFILIEREDYADSITAERVKRVINGYGEGKSAVEGTGGSFSFYELGERLMLENGTLNPDMDIRSIRGYIWHTETKKPLPDVGQIDNKYFLAADGDVAYYFFYEKDRATTLDRPFLRTIKTKAESYIIYADQCAISDQELQKHNISFKKIPRDIINL